VLRTLRLVASVSALLAACLAPAQPLGPTLDPLPILAQAKAASGGEAWDALRTQHSKVRIQAGARSGRAERWSEMRSGRSAIDYEMDGVMGSAGFDGNVAWTREGSGPAVVESDETARELAVNAAYRDRLAFWYPERAPAAIAYKESAIADDAVFHVIRITPEGGRPFELWINRDTRLIERLVEREAKATRTEVYMDLRDVDGVKVPFRVRASRGSARYDEIVIVEAMAFNEPVPAARFALPQ
jgi:hypothetical protein